MPDIQLPTVALGANPSAPSDTVSARPYISQMMGRLFDDVSTTFKTMDTLVAMVQPPGSSAPPSRIIDEMPGPSTLRPVEAPPQTPPPATHNNNLSRQIQAFSTLMNTPSSAPLFVDECVSDIGFLSRNIARLTSQVEQPPPNQNPSPDDQTILGLYHALRYEMAADPNDFEQAYRHTSLALDDADEAVRRTFVKHWAFVLILEAERDGEKCDGAIQALEDTLRSLPDDSPAKASLCLHLASALVQRYSISDDLKDLQEAIPYASSAEPSDRNALMPLSVAYRRRFERQGSITDLDAALQNARWVTMRRKDHRNLKFARAAHNLSVCLAHVFALTGADVYSHEAISTCQQAIECTGPHPLLRRFKTDLASMYLARYDTSNDDDDLSSAIRLGREAVEEELDRRNIYLAESQSLLGVILGRQYTRHGCLTSLMEGISYCRSAVETNSASPPVRVLCHSRYSHLLFSLAQHTGNSENFDESIHHGQLALSLAADDDRARTQVKFDLGTMLLARYQKYRNTTDLDEGIRCFREVASAAFGFPSLLFAGAMAWADAGAFKDGESSLEALSAAISLLPRIAWIGHKMRRRFQEMASQSAGLACRAAASAIECNDLWRAIDLLEKGRTVLWSQSLHIHSSNTEGTGTKPHHLADYLNKAAHDTPRVPINRGLLRHVFGPDFDVDSFPGISDLPPSTLNDRGFPELQRINPNFPHPIVPQLVEPLNKLFQRMKYLRTRLDPAFVADMDTIWRDHRSFKDKASAEVGESSLHRLALAWEESQRQLAPVDVQPYAIPSQILNRLCAESERTIVILNAHQARCDAIIVDRNTPAQLLRLPNLTFRDALQWATKLREANGHFVNGRISGSDFERHTLLPILRELWDTVCNPVLSAIEANRPLPRRIWWCPTGPLTFLPIHAAGPYRKGHLGLMDRVVSSYTPTINALWRSHESRKTTPLRLLAVSQPHTPDHAAIPNASLEIETIREICFDPPERLTCLEGSQGTVANVMDAFKHHNWFHFACHGRQDLNYAFDSSFILHDGDFRLSRLMITDVPDVEFAMMLACSMSTGDDKLPDECIHMAAGLQYSGARGMVSTMWPIADEDAILVTKEFYQHMFRDSSREPDATEAAEALHKATLALKAARVPLYRRVPFIHIGM